MYLSLIYLFKNSTQAFLKFSFITVSHIAELSNFSSPLLFSVFPFEGFGYFFFSNSQSEKELFPGNYV